MGKINQTINNSYGIGSQWDALIQTRNGLNWPIGVVTQMICQWNGSSMARTMTRRRAITLNNANWLSIKFEDQEESSMAFEI